MRQRLSIGFVALIVGCGGNGSSGSGFTAGSDGGAGDDGGAPVDVDGGGPSGTLGDDAATDASSAKGTTLLYAHDNTTLYKVDPTDPKLGITTVGTFDCVGGAGQPSSMTDIAVDASGKLYGVATSTVFLDMTVAGGTVACAKGAKPLAAGGVNTNKVKFYGASFAPRGTLDPNAETLVVGNTDGEMYAVDTTSGAITIVGTFGTVPANDGNGHAYANAGTAWEMSGDIVFLSNGGAPLGFATVRDCPSPPSTTGCSKTDTLIELDMSRLKAGNTASVTKAVRGQIVKGASCTDAQNTSYGSMYGIAAFEDKVVGFSHSGFVVDVSNVDGTACLIADDAALLQKPNGFDGAGVTTSAPVVAPPPK